MICLSNLATANNYTSYVTINYNNYNNMKVSKKMVEFITSFEGFEPKPYLDIADVPTIGFGATYYENGVKVTMKDAPITKERALELKAFHLRIAEAAVNKFVKANINQNQFDALVSFTYNLGVGALQNSTLLKKVNANPNDESIANEFKKWVNARNKKTGKLEKSNGLIRRRNEESTFYFS